MARSSENWKELLYSDAVYSKARPEAYKETAGSISSDHFLQALVRYSAPGAIVLEAGCGEAYYSFALADRNRTAHAIDISSKLVERLNLLKAHFSAGVQGRLTIRTHDLFKLTDYPAKFDLIFNHGVFEHLSPAEREKSLDEIRGSLSKTGKVIIAVPNSGNPIFSSLVSDKAPYMDNLDNGLLEGELERGSFKVIEKGFLFVGPGYRQWLRLDFLATPIDLFRKIFPLLPIFLRRVFAAHFFVVAEPIPSRANEISCQTAGKA